MILTYLTSKQLGFLGKLTGEWQVCWNWKNS